MTPEVWFHRVATRYVEAQVLFHLNAVGVFERLDTSGPASAAELAAELGLVEPVLATLLEYICGVDGLIALEAGSATYELTPWGLEVLERYGRRHADGRSFNFFDVRVGAYGPVWSALDRMLTGEVRYGRELTRTGAMAADAVYKVGARLEAPLGAIVDTLGAACVVEVGVTSGLLERLADGRPELGLVGLDRDPAALADLAGRAARAGVTRCRWVEGDFFTPDTWAARLPDVASAVVFSIHFHELLAAGEDRVIEALRRLAAVRPGWHVVAMEQPRLPEADRGRVSETLWLYNHSNLLIHHLIGNGRILTDAGWRGLFERAGCRITSVTPLRYLGYQAYTARL